MELIRNTNYWIYNNELNQNQIKKYLSFLKQLLATIKTYGIDFDEADQLIREISKTILFLKNEENYLWDLLLLTFKSFKHFFSDETIKLISTYQDNEQKNITKLLDLFFSGYSEHYISERVLLNVYNIVSKNPKYKRKSKEWKVCILSVNPNLLNKL